MVFMLTPLDPRIRNVIQTLTAIIILFCSGISHANSFQRRISNTNEDTDEIEIQKIASSLHQKYQKNLEADLDELKQDKRLSYLRFAPSVGYDLTRNAVVVGFSFNNVITHLRDRKANRSKKKRVLEHYKNLIHSDISKIDNLQLRKNYLESDLKASQEILNLENQRFKIDSLKYINHEIKTSLFLDKKIEILKKRKALNQTQLQLKTISNEIKNISNLNNRASSYY